MPTTKQINLPLAVVISLLAAVGGFALSTGGVRSDVGHLTERMAHVESRVEVLSSDDALLKITQASGDARDAGRWLAVELKLGEIEESLQGLLAASRGDDRRDR